MTIIMICKRDTISSSHSPLALSYLWSAVSFFTNVQEAGDGSGAGKGGGGEGGRGLGVAEPD